LELLAPVRLGRLLFLLKLLGKLLRYPPHGVAPWLDLVGNAARPTLFGIGAAAGDAQADVLEFAGTYGEEGFGIVVVANLSL